MGFYNQFEDTSHLRISILLKILKMAYKITLAFFAVLIFGTYSAPSPGAPGPAPADEPSEDKSIKNVTQCYNGNYTISNTTIRSEVLSKLELTACNDGACFGRKVEGKITFGCTTQHPDIKDGTCKDDIKGNNNGTIKECHCHNDSECIFPLMGIPDEKPQDKPEDKPKEKPEEKPMTCNNEEHGRHYDGLSFFGGILLTVSVSLIGFFVYRKCHHPHAIESQRLWN